MWGLLPQGEGRKAGPVPLLLVLWPGSSLEDILSSISLRRMLRPKEDYRLSVPQIDICQL